MTGPTASVFLPAPANAEAVFACVDENFSTIRPEGGEANVFDGRIENRHFVLTCGLEYPERLDDLDMAALAEFCGWTPVDEIKIVAMARKGEEDHLILGRLCIQLAARFGGVISLGEKPWTLSAEVEKQLAGRIILLRPFDAGEALSEKATQCFCDEAFMRSWIKQPVFRMAK